MKVVTTGFIKQGKARPCDVKHNSYTITSQKEQKKKYQNNEWIAVSLINQYNCTEYNF